jgi:hypothetical protein
VINEYTIGSKDNPTACQHTVEDQTHFLRCNASSNWPIWFPDPFPKHSTTAESDQMLTAMMLEGNIPWLTETSCPSPSGISPRHPFELGKRQCFLMHCFLIHYNPYSPE